MYIYLDMLESGIYGCECIFRLNGFKDGSESWTEPYESDTFIEEMAETWEGLKPLYEQMHAFVRQRLVSKYGEEVVSRDGPIPAHLLGILNILVHFNFRHDQSISCFQATCGLRIGVTLEHLSNHIPINQA